MKSGLNFGYRDTLGDISFCAKLFFRNIYEISR